MVFPLKSPGLSRASTPAATPFTTRKRCPLFAYCLRSDRQYQSGLTEVLFFKFLGSSLITSKMPFTPCRSTSMSCKRLYALTAAHSLRSQLTFLLVFPPRDRKIFAPTYMTPNDERGPEQLTQLFFAGGHGGVGGGDQHEWPCKSIDLPSQLMSLLSTACLTLCNFLDVQCRTLRSIG